MGIIPGVIPKSKALLGRISVDWLIVALIILSASAAFGLGFLAGKDVGEKGELQILGGEEVKGVTAPTEETSVAQGGQYVASKTGKSYHLPSCSGAKLIKEENKIWFSTKEEAEGRGYRPAGNCPGI